jgi:hypothetical protein
MVLHKRQILLTAICVAENSAGRRAIISSAGADVLHDMLMLGSGHSDEEGSVDHALMLLALLMRDTDVAYMFAQEVIFIRKQTENML